MAVMLDPISDIESRVARLGVPLNDVLKAAPVHISTWLRWKGNRSGATVKKLRAIYDEIERREQA